MRTINALRDICKRFENGNFGLEELQGRLTIVITPEPDFHNFDKLLFKIDNDLEEIIYTELESNHRKYGIKVIHSMLNKLNEIEKNV